MENSTKSIQVDYYLKIGVDHEIPVPMFELKHEGFITANTIITWKGKSYRVTQVRVKALMGFEENSLWVYVDVEEI